MTIGQLYKTGAGDVKATKTYNVGLELLYIEDGFNVRDICDEHVGAISDAYRAGEYLPPIVVKHMPDGRLKIIDGHHRFLAAKQAEVLRLECKDYTGSDADQVAMMITSSQGRQLSTTERANAYLRLHRLGYTYDEIAAKCKRSRADVDNHMTLATADHQIFEHVKSGVVSMNEANQLIRKKGEKAVEIINKAVEKAESKGEKKVQATDLHRFTNKMAMRFVELSVLEFEDRTPDSGAELNSLRDAYRKFKEQ